jgi:S-(hydroxymethyl)glutathione dehydrogenase/alcohol dehydrogenase
MSKVRSRAAVLRVEGGPLELEEIHWDDPRDNEVGVRVVACGVCHSDWHAVTGDYPVTYPILVGHEGTGTVERIGSAVSRVQSGDPVVLSWMPSCGHCSWCVQGRGHLCDRGARLLSGERDDGTTRATLSDGTPIRQLSFLGAFSEYIVVPEDACIPVPRTLRLESLAPIGCRLPTGWGAVTNVAAVQEGESALVVGLGGVGISVLQGLRHAGATVRIAADVADKEGFATRFGATHFINLSREPLDQRVRQVCPAGVDVAFDAVGRPEIQAACVGLTTKGGRTILVGVAPQGVKSLEADLQNVTLYERSVRGVCYGGESPFSLVPKLLALYEGGLLEIEEMVTRRYHLGEVNEAFADMLSGKNVCGTIDF